MGGWGHLLAIWKCRNKAVFEKKVIKNPLEIFYHIYALMMYWACLYEGWDWEQLEKGANVLLQMAKKILAAHTTAQVNHLLLQGGDQDEEDDDST